MKVVHICNLPLPIDHPDYGRVRYHPGRWVLNLALAQASHTKIKPEILVQVAGASRNFSTSIDGIPVYFVAAPYRFRSMTLFWFDSRRLASHLSALRPDLVHAHGTEDAYGLAAQRSGYPNVITLQGAFFIINRIIIPPLISRARAVELTEKICLRRARHVIAKSEYVAAHLKEHFPHLTIHRIPNTIDPRLFNISEDKHRHVLAFVGVIDRRKGLELLCEALEIVQLDIPEVKLWVFGDYPHTPSTYEQEIKARIRLILGERVVFHGTVPSLEVVREVAKAAALVAPSREEMFGNQLIEALVVGTHSIVAEGTALAENVRRFGNGTIIPQDDPEGLAKAIVKALTEPTPNVKVQQARDAVATDFGPAKVAKLHSKVYEQVLRGR